MSADAPVSGAAGSGTRGFTLIEIMVALVVLSLAALALIRLEGQTIRSTGIVSSTLLAQIVARNVAIEAVTDAQPPLRGRATGVEQAGGRNWTWTRDVQPLGDGDVQRVDVAVSDGGGAILGRATMVRPPAASIQTRIGQSAGRQPAGGQQGGGATGQGS
jgi:general secretion pathway protein I